MEPALIDTADHAEYVSSMLLQLGQMARHSGNDFLFYLIDMARMEADSHAMSLTAEAHNDRRAPR